MDKLLHSIISYVFDYLSTHDKYDAALDHSSK